MAQYCVPGDSACNRIGAVHCTCYYCVRAGFQVTPDSSNPSVYCSFRSMAEAGYHPCTPNAICPSPWLTANVTDGFKYELIESSPFQNQFPTPPEGGPGKCGCTGTYQKICYCDANTGFINSLYADSTSSAEILLSANNIPFRNLHAVAWNQPCGDPRGACCTPDGGCIQNSNICNCDFNDGVLHVDKTCAEACGAGSCCHCDWCCDNLDEDECESAGGQFRAGQACPANNGPCNNAQCPPCHLEGFALAMPSSSNAVSTPADGGYWPIATIRAFDGPTSNDPVRISHANLSVTSFNKVYSARSCNQYNRRLTGQPQAVSTCALSAVGENENVYQFICPYREPCRETPNNCLRN